MSACVRYVKSKKKGARPGIEHRSCQLRVGCFGPIKLSSLFFDLTFIRNTRFLPAHLLSYYRISVHRLGYILFSCFFWMLWPLSYDNIKPPGRVELPAFEKQEGNAVTFVVPLHQIWSSALCYVSAAILDISIIPENNLMYRHTPTGFRYVRSRTICQIEKTRC